MKGVCSGLQGLKVQGQPRTHSEINIKHTHTVSGPAQLVHMFLKKKMRTEEGKRQEMDDRVGRAPVNTVTASSLSLIVLIYLNQKGRAKDLPPLETRI